MNQDLLQKTANTIRGLSMDAIHQANSGHPGLPLGCAEIAAYLFGHAMTFNPSNPNWMNRDRFILSAGHGSMLLYSALHLAGYAISLEDIQNFRQYQSKTPGHPEYQETPGVETTTGPLGQGLANAVGIALGNKMLQQQHQLNELLESTIYCLVGDGCLMEGISSEVGSLAGHWGLGNLVVIYDANNICLDGPIDECFTEQVADRFKAFGWDVATIDGHDLTQLDTAVQNAKQNTKQPSMIVAKTIIGKSAPNQGKSDVHGKPLNAEECQSAKKQLGLKEDALFFIPKEVQVYFEDRVQAQQAKDAQWQVAFEKWQSENAEKATALASQKPNQVSDALVNAISEFDIKSGIATRESSHQLIQVIHQNMPSFVGGSADLSCSDKAFIKGTTIIEKESFTGYQIKFGVREFGMAAICNGLFLQGAWRPFCGTFFTFSDYMKNAIRLAALMKLPVIYQFTHDSIFVGEDGPTHQPVEHLAGLRAMPGLKVIRPADNTEMKGAWIAALQSETPVALVLSRQSMPDIATTDIKKVQKGAYIIKEANKDAVDYCLLATGSEVSLAMNVATQLEEKGKTVRVVSFPSWEMFEAQSDDYKDAVLGGDVSRFVSIEALSSLGWHRYIGKDGIAISVDTFGLSAPGKDLATHFGFTVDQIVNQLVSNDKN